MSNPGADRQMAEDSQPHEASRPATRADAPVPAGLFKVRILNTGQEITCAGDKTLLDAAVLAGVDYPYACASGNCGACISRLESGTVTMLPRGDASLSPEQAASGHTLACRARPQSDVTIQWLARGRR